MDTLREAASAACRDYLVSHVLAVEIGASRTARMLAPSVVDNQPLGWGLQNVVELPETLWREVAAKPGLQTAVPSVPLLDPPSMAGISCLTSGPPGAGRVCLRGHACVHNQLFAYMNNRISA